MTNTEKTNNNDNSRNNIAKPFVIQALYGASISIITVVGYILYDLYPNFFIKYLVFILFLFSICIFSFILPSNNGWIYRLDSINDSKNKKRADLLANQIAKSFFNFIPGSQVAISAFILVFISNPTLIVPIITPFILIIIYIFNSLIEYISVGFK